MYEVGSSTAGSQHRLQQWTSPATADEPEESELRGWLLNSRVSSSPATADKEEESVRGWFPQRPPSGVRPASSGKHSYNS